MSNQVPYATISDENRIVNALMCMGYSREEIDAGFSLQARSNGDFTVESVRDAIWRWRRLTIDLTQMDIDEQAERIGVLLRQVRAVRGQELRALVARAATDAERQEWQADKKDAENVTWMCVEAIDT